MKLEVYEYSINDKKVGIYTGSYTIREDCSNKKELQKNLKSRLVDKVKR